MKKTLLLFFFLMLFKDNIAQVSTQENIVYDFVQQPPKFPGGQEALIKFIAQNLTNIKSSSDKYNAPTKIIVQFIVMKDSSLRDIKVIKGGSPEIDSAVSQLFQKMPKWIPAEQNGYLVNARFVLPLNIEYDVEEIEQPEPPSIPEEIEYKDVVYDMVVKKASFPGGVEAMNTFIEKNLTYPESLFENRNNEEVEVSMKVLENGSLFNIEIKKSTNEVCNKPALEVVQKMPKWNPAMIGDGEAKAMIVNVTILFTPDKKTEKMKRKNGLILVE